MNTVSVIVGTYGPDRAFWDNLANRAVESITAQTVKPTEMHRVHVLEDNALHVARNRGAAMSFSDWLIFCDADDCLHPEYVEAMLAGEGDVRIPNRERFYWDGTHKPVDQIPAGKDLLRHSHILIGAMVRRDLFIKVGGFADLPIWEDWHFWCKCWVSGASMIQCPRAIYQTHIRPGSRGQQLGNVGQAARIRMEFEPLARAKGLLAEQRSAEALKQKFGISRETAEAC
jgi:hypothetical protein